MDQNHPNCVSLMNQKYMIQPTTISLHPSEYSLKLHYYPVAVKLDKRLGSFNTLINELSNKVCVPKKTEDSIIDDYYWWFKNYLQWSYRLGSKVRTSKKQKQF